MDELVDLELLEQVAISKHHVFPEVHIFPNYFRELLATLAFDLEWVEKSLRNLHMVRVFRQLAQTTEVLCGERLVICSARRSEPKVWDARDESDYGLF